MTTALELLSAIRQEIERKKEYYALKEEKAWDGYRSADDAFYYQGKQKMCVELLSFLDTLAVESKPSTFCKGRIVDGKLEVEDID